jgi:hypothetical protein
MTLSERRYDDEPFNTFLQLLHQEAATLFHDAEELRDEGFSPIRVRGSASVLWERGGEYFGTREALAEIRASEVEASDNARGLFEHGFSPITVRGSPSMILAQNGNYFTLEAALDEIRPTIEGEEA